MSTFTGPLFFSSSHPPPLIPCSPSSLLYNFLFDPVTSAKDPRHFTFIPFTLFPFRRPSLHSQSFAGTLLRDVLLRPQFSPPSKPPPPAEVGGVRGSSPTSHSLQPRPHPPPLLTVCSTLPAIWQMRIDKASPSFADVGWPEAAEYVGVIHTGGGRVM